MKTIFASLLLAAGILFGSPPAPPNFVLVMSDDQGWGDVGYQGHAHLRTPNLDALAREGVRFDRFYAAAAVCSPTRGSVLTGRSPGRFDNFSWGHPLRPEEVTIAEVLRPAGYRTGHFGKWHLGSVQNGRSTSPGAQGFDEWVSSPNFFDFDPLLSVQGRAVPFKGESSEITVNLALDFIRRCTKAGQRYFAVVWLSAPHVPHQATDADRLPYLGLSEAQQHYLGEITAMDRAFGRLRRELRELDGSGNTVLWFCSDNGALPEVGSTGGRRGLKASLYDGGLMVPALLEWPARFSGPRIIDVPCGTSDIYPTVLEITGAKAAHQPPLDGISLVPFLTGAARQRSRPIGFWDNGKPGVRTPAKEWMEAMRAAQERGEEPADPEPPLTPPGGTGTPVPAGRFPGHAAWLDWPWKLHRIENAQTGATVWELYDLSKDPAEQRPVSAGEAPRLPELQSALESWLAGVVRSLNGADHR